MDLKLTPSTAPATPGKGDIELENGALSWVDGLDAIRQEIEMTLGTWLGETPYDTAAGVPYLQVIFVRGTPTASIQFIIEQQILKVPGVTEVKELTAAIDSTTRALTITGVAIADGEEIDFSTGVTP